MLALVVVVASLVAGAGAGYLAGMRADRWRDAPPATDAPPGVGFDAAAAFERAAPSVVTVRVTLSATPARTGSTVAPSESTGTGIVWRADGLVLTNAHVVSPATTVSVTLPGEGQIRPAQVVGRDLAADVAVLRVDGTEALTPATFRTTVPGVGEPVLVVGHALGLTGGPSVTQGIVSALDRATATRGGVVLDGLVQTDAGISSGDSGGPMVDAAGAVVAMNTAGASGTVATTVENVGFAIPSARVLAVAEALLADRR